MQEAKRKAFIINAAYYGIILIVVLALFRYVVPIMVPFIIAFCVSALMQIPLGKMKLRLKQTRKIMSIVLCAVFYAIVGVIALLVGSRLLKEAGDLIRAIPKLFNELRPLIDHAFNELETAVLPYDTSLATVIDSMATTTIQTIGKAVTDFSGKALVLVTSYATEIPGVIVSVVITIISTFFMAIDFDLIISFLKKLVPSSKQDLLDTSVHYTKSMVMVYIKSYALLFTLTFVELSIGFSLLGIPYAILLALIISIFDLMPILGTGGILLPWALILVLMGNYRLAAGIAALYVVITAVRQTLEPKIVGAQIGLHPLATLIAMLLGLGLFGLVGLIGFPVTLAVMIAMHRTKKAGEEARRKKQEEEAAAQAEAQAEAQE